MYVHVFKIISDFNRINIDLNCMHRSVYGLSFLPEHTKCFRLCLFLLFWATRLQLTDIRHDRQIIRSSYSTECGSPEYCESGSLGQAGVSPYGSDPDGNVFYRTGRVCQKSTVVMIRLDAHALPPGRPAADTATRHICFDDGYCNKAILNSCFLSSIHCACCSRLLFELCSPATIGQLAPSGDDHYAMSLDIEVQRSRRLVSDTSKWKF